MQEFFEIIFLFPNINHKEQIMTQQENSANPSKGIHRLCPLCGTDNAVAKPSVYSRDQWIIKMCTECHFVYLENPPSYQELGRNLRLGEDIASGGAKENGIRTAARRSDYRTSQRQTDSQG